MKTISAFLRFCCRRPKEIAGRISLSLLFPISIPIIIRIADRLLCGAGLWSSAPASSMRGKEGGTPHLNSAAAVSKSPAPEKTLRTVYLRGWCSWIRWCMPYPPTFMGLITSLLSSWHKRQHFFGHDRVKAKLPTIFSWPSFFLFYWFEFFLFAQANPFPNFWYSVLRGCVLGLLKSGIHFFSATQYVLKHLFF